MKTIFITSFHPHISRNILSTDILNILTEITDLRTVVIVPDFKIEYFRERYGGGKVAIEGIRQYQSSRTLRGLLFKRLSRVLLPSGTVRAKMRYKFYWEGKVFYYIIAYLINRCGGSRTLRTTVRTLDLLLSPRGWSPALFDKWQPRLVFATDVQNENDVSVMQEARRRGVPILGMWRSWDNPTQQTLRVYPDRLIAGSEELKRETLELEGYPEERIVVSGQPHYDRYLLSPTKGRKEFFEELSLDPSRKLILFAPGGDKVIKYNDLDQHIIEILSSVEANVLVRFPPGEDITLFNFRKTPNIVIEKPGHRFCSKRGEFEIRLEDDESLRNELNYADVVITGPTSICLDAALLDKPVVMADVYPSNRHIFEKGWGNLLDHIDKLRQTRGVRIVETKRELRQAIEDYFKNPKLDSGGRSRILKMWFSHIEGSASERVAGEIISLLNQRV